MRKTILLPIWLLLCAMVYAQPNISDLTFPKSSPLFGLYELSFQLGNYSNPYDPDIIDVYAIFEGPDGKSFKVNGFYYEGYRLYLHYGYEKAEAIDKDKGWRVRFTPNQVGTWHFTLHAIDKKGYTNLSSYGVMDFVFNCDTVKTASGFITKANSKYLKREVVIDGQKTSRSFFPIGPNLPYYNCKSYYDFSTPLGIYEYERRIDSLSGNANYFRLFINRPQALSLYGAEFTQMVDGKPVVYFDNRINQKDAAELDHIINYAALNGLSVIPCIFTYPDLKNNPEYDNNLDKHPDDWRCNPFHTQLGLKSNEDFFTDNESIRITRNLIRYVVARWGYATNIISWEFWNEVRNMVYDRKEVERFCAKLMSWHDEMTELIRSNDPFHHLISTSLGGSADPNEYIYKRMFNNLDFVMHHQYFNVQEAKSKQQPSYYIYLISQSTNKLYPSKPFFIAEYGFGDLTPANYAIKDPFSIDLHNTLWSTLFSGMMGPASFWERHALDYCGTHGRFKPLLTFCQNLPVLSDSFKAQTTGTLGKDKTSVVFPNHLETYYIINETQDTLYGWSQDTAFCYQSLRRLTDIVTEKKHFSDDSPVDKAGYVYTFNPDKRPRPSSKSNTITLPIEKQPIGTQYLVKWYDSETGLELVSERVTATVGKQQTLSFEFPSSIRDLKKRRINNSFGDAVFALYRLSSSATKNGGAIQVSTTNGKKTNKTIKLKRQ